MIYITEKLIRNYADDITYKRGSDYFRMGKVIDLAVEIENNKYYKFNVYSIDAWVESSDFDEYNVQIVFNDKSGFSHFKCDCQIFSGGYGRRGVCKHVVAVLIKYIKQYQTKDAKTMYSMKMDKLIRELRNNLVRNSSGKRDLHLQVKYCYDRSEEITSSIELKLGVDRLYVVRNMREFLRALENSEILEFGKGFTYNPFEHKFCEEDRKLIDFFTEISELDTRIQYVNDSNNVGARLINGKKLFLMEKQLRRFFSLIKNRYFEVSIMEESYSSVRIMEEDLPLQFTLAMESNKIVLAHGSEIPRPLSSNGRYYFYKGNVYMPPPEQLKTYIPFYNAFISERSPVLTFNKEDGDKIASFVLPGLRKISSEVMLDKNLEENFYEEPLNIEIYLDRDKDYAAAEIRYKYGSISINPLKEGTVRSERGILLRDIDEEINAITIVESFGFTKDKDKYLIRDEDKLIDFIREGVPKLQEIGQIYYSDAFKNMKIYTSSNYRSSIRLSDEDLLEFSFDIDGVDKNELKNIFKALREKRKYYKLKKGGFVSLEEENLKRIGDMIEYLDIKDSELSKNKILLAKYNAMYIDATLKESDMSFVDRNKNFRELTNNIKDIKDMDYSLPQHLEEIMRNYQKIGYKWFKTLSAFGFGGILADEMGLGKTLQTIAFLESEKGGAPSLVIAPTSLIYNWHSEIEKFSPSLRTLIVSGNKSERKELRKDIEGCDIVITSYPLIRRDIEAYRDIEFKYCILDEAQHIKNPSSMNANSVKEIKAKGYFALTGTPIENSLTELWSIFDFIMPGYLMNYNRFVQNYETPIAKNKDRKVVQELSKHIKPFILRRLKKEVIKELPPKIEHKLIVEMTEEQKKLYMAYVNLLKSEIDEEIRHRGFDKSRIKILAALTRLRQICCDPSVFIESYAGDSGKLVALDELLQESIDSGHRILLFSQFTSVLKNISKRLEGSNIEYLYLDGSTKAEDRGALVRAFNKGKGSVFLISLKAGGTGLNLTGADIVIHFDPWWNPSAEDQATDRAHRIGQRKTVEVIKLVSKGTIEEKICILQEKKRDIINAVINEDMNEENVISHMSQHEIEELFNLE
jgi:SNF2 family DNA or RNA helicase